MTMEVSNAAQCRAEIAAACEPAAVAASEGLARRLDICDVQGMTNTVWAFATLVFRDPPLRDAISAAARRRRDANAQSVTTLVWSWWKLSLSPEAWPILEESSSRGVSLDAMGFSYGIML